MTADNYTGSQSDRVTSVELTSQLTRPSASMVVSAASRTAPPDHDIELITRYTTDVTDLLLGRGSHSALIYSRHALLALNTSVDRDTGRHLSNDERRASIERLGSAAFANPWILAQEIVKSVIAGSDIDIAPLEDSNSGRRIDQINEVANLILGGQYNVPTRYLTEAERGRIASVKRRLGDLQMQKSEKPLRPEEYRLLTQQLRIIEPVVVAAPFKYRYAQVALSESRARRGAKINASLAIVAPEFPLMAGIRRGAGAPNTYLDDAYVGYDKYPSPLRKVLTLSLFKPEILQRPGIIGPDGMVDLSKLSSEEYISIGYSVVLKRTMDGTRDILVWVDNDKRCEGLSVRMGWRSARMLQLAFLSQRFGTVTVSSTSKPEDVLPNRLIDALPSGSSVLRQPRYIVNSGIPSAGDGSRQSDTEAVLSGHFTASKKIANILEQVRIAREEVLSSKAGEEITEETQILATGEALTKVFQDNPEIKNEMPGYLATGIIDPEREVKRRIVASFGSLINDIGLQEYVVEDVMTVADLIEFIFDQRAQVGLTPDLKFIENLRDLVIGAYELQDDRFAYIRDAIQEIFEEVAYERVEDAHHGAGVIILDAPSDFITPADLWKAQVEQEQQEAAARARQETAEQMRQAGDRARETGITSLYALYPDLNIQQVADAYDRADGDMGQAEDELDGLRRQGNRQNNRRAEVNWSRLKKWRAHLTLGALGIALALTIALRAPKSVVVQTGDDDGDNGPQAGEVLRAASSSAALEAVIGEFCRPTTHKDEVGQPRLGVLDGSYAIIAPVEGQNGTDELAFIGIAEVDGDIQSEKGEGANMQGGEGTPLLDCPDPIVELGNVGNLPDQLKELVAKGYAFSSLLIKDGNGNYVLAPNRPDPEKPKPKEEVSLHLINGGIEGEKAVNAVFVDLGKEFTRADIQKAMEAAQNK